MAFSSVLLTLDCAWGLVNQSSTCLVSGKLLPLAIAPSSASTAGELKSCEFSLCSFLGSTSCELSEASVVPSFPIRCSASSFTCGSDSRRGSELERGRDSSITSMSVQGTEPWRGLVGLLSDCCTV